MDEVTLKVGTVVGFYNDRTEELEDYVVGVCEPSSPGSRVSYVRLDAKFVPSIRLYIREIE